MIKYNATYDLVFKEVFSKKNIASNLLSLILDKEIKENSLVNVQTEITNGIDYKLSNLDIRFQIMEEDTYDIDMEMQRRKPPYEIERRLLYYACKLLMSEIKKGEEYPKKNVVVICIVDYTIYNDNAYRHEYRLRCNDEEVEGFEIITIELTKRNKCDKIKLREWMELIKANELDKYIEGEDELMKEAAEEINKINEDEVMRATLFAREKAEMDYYAGLAASERIGREQGYKKGEREGMRKIIRNMLAKGFTLEQISLATDLKIEEINKLI